MPKRAKMSAPAFEEKILAKQQSALEKIRDHMQSEQMLPLELQMVQKEAEQRSRRNIDVDYIQTVVFPETNFADLPQPLSCQSFSKFTNKMEGSISYDSTNSSAQNGVILWFPHVNSGPCLFYLTGASVTTGIPSVGTASNSAPAASTVITTDKWYAGFNQDYAASFTSTALVSASLQIQYTGKLENEQGYMVGGHLYGTSLSTLSIADIEEAQQVTRVRPGEGLRFTHLPSDTSDFEYYNAQQFVAHNQGASVQANQDASFSIGTANFQYIDAFSQAAVANTQAITYASQSHCVAIYFTGLDMSGSKQFRLDMVRRFNGTPKTSIKDITTLIKPRRAFDSRKTFDALQQLMAMVPIGGHPLKEMISLMDKLQFNFANIVEVLEHSDEAGDMSLQDFAQSLQNPGILGQKQMGGLRQGMMQRLYPFM